MEPHAAVIGKLEAIKIFERKNSEFPQNMKVVIVYDWEREILFFKECYQHEEDNSLEMEAFDTSRPKGEMLQDIVLDLQKFAVSHRSLPIYAYDRADLSRPVFATEKCTALRDKVVQFHGIRVSDVFEVNADYNGCRMEMCFFVHGSCKNNLFFTAGFSNPTATDELAIKLLDAANIHNALDHIGFAVSLSDDDYFKINEYVNKVADVLTKRLQQAKRDYDSCVMHEDRPPFDETREDVEQTPEEYAKMSEYAFKRFFLTPDEKAKEKEKEEKEAEEAELSSLHWAPRLLRSSTRRLKPNMIDLTNEDVALVIADPTECLDDDVFFDLNVSDIGEGGVSFDNFFDKKLTTCRLGWDTRVECAVNNEKAESDEFKKWFSELKATVPDGHKDLLPPSKLATGMDAILDRMIHKDPKYADLIESVLEIIDAMKRSSTCVENSQQQEGSPGLTMANLNISDPQSDHHQGAAYHYLNKSARDYGNKRYSGSAMNATMPVLGRGSYGNIIHLTDEKTTLKSKLFEKREVITYLDSEKKRRGCAGFKIPKKGQSFEHSVRDSPPLPPFNDQPSSSIIKGRPPIRPPKESLLYTKPRSHFDGERGRKMLEMLPKHLEGASPMKGIAPSQQRSETNTVIELNDESEEETDDERVQGNQPRKRKQLYTAEEPEKQYSIFKSKKPRGPKFGGNGKRDGSHP